MNDMDKLDKREALSRLAEQAVPDSLDLWPRVRAQTGARPAPTPTGMRRRIFVGLTVAALLVLLAAGASSLWNTATPVSAQAILDQAQSTAASPKAAVHTYHLLLTQQVPGKGNVSINTEIWFGGSDRQRSSVQTKDAGGAVVQLTEVIFHSAQAWLATTANGQTQVVHTNGTTWTEPAEDPSRQNSLIDVLTKYGNPKFCMDALLQGEASVGGQATYVIAATPKAGGCDPNANNGTPDPKARSGEPAKTGIAPGTARSNGGTKIGQMLVWVDKVSFLPLKTEVRSTTGVLLEQALVTAVEYNIPIPDSVFDYTAPAGAKVFNFNGGSGADVKAKLCADPAFSGCQQAK